jgi:hypothetical protein
MDTLYGLVSKVLTIIFLKPFEIMRAVEESDIVFLMEVRDKAFPVRYRPDLPSPLSSLKVSSCYCALQAAKHLWSTQFGSEKRTSPLSS